MNKKQLQKKADGRLNAIKASFENELYDEAVSDSGLVVEFALKAVICKDRKNKIYPENIFTYRTHDPERLIDLAKMRADLENEKNNNIDFFINWSLLSKWSIDFRYKPPGTYNKDSARDYINAIENEIGGVYPWIKRYW